MKRQKVKIKKEPKPAPFYFKHLKIQKLFNAGRSSVFKLNIQSADC